MAVTIINEKIESRRSTVGENASVELVYSIISAVDDIDAKTKLGTTAPATYDGLARKSIVIEPITETDFEGIVTYGVSTISFPSTGESSFSFDISGGQQKITQGKGHIASYAPPGGTSANFKGAIGVTKDGVEGTSIIVPSYNFSEKHYIASATVTGTYKANIFSLTGTTNLAAFKGFSIGEVLFMGANGTMRDNQTGASPDWEINFSFAALPNATGLVVGDITGIAKKGWEYLWVQYAEEEDAAAGSLVQVPISAHVERVYDAGDFSLLGIGV